jgi:hypothetical protein
MVLAASACASASIVYTLTAHKTESSDGCEFGARSCGDGLSLPCLCAGDVLLGVCNDYPVDDGALFPRKTCPSGRLAHGGGRTAVCGLGARRLRPAGAPLVPRALLPLCAGCRRAGLAMGRGARRGHGGAGRGDGGRGHGRRLACGCRLCAWCVQVGVGRYCGRVVSLGRGWRIGRRAITGPSRVLSCRARRRSGSG